MIETRPPAMNSNDPTIEELVDGLFIPDRSAACYDRLKNTGNRAVRLLVAAVNKSSLATDALHRSIPQDFPNLDSPLYRIGELLAASGSGSAPAVTHFLHNLTSRDQRLREYAAWGLGSIALSNCGEPVMRILATEERRARRKDTVFRVGFASR
jgi:hypothetical protein